MTQIGADENFYLIPQMKAIINASRWRQIGADEKLYFR